MIHDSKITSKYRMMGNYCVGYDFCGGGGVTELKDCIGCGDGCFSEAKDHVGIE